MSSYYIPPFHRKSPPIFFLTGNQAAPIIRLAIKRLPCGACNQLKWQTRRSSVCTIRAEILQLDTFSNADTKAYALPESHSPRRLRPRVENHKKDAENRMTAILYTSNAGSTERYSRLLSQETGLPVYSLSEAQRTVPVGSTVLYLGWIMAGNIKGYARAAKAYDVRAVCAVGLSPTGTQDASLRQRTGIPASTPLFTLQGAFHFEQLHGIYRLMAKLLRVFAGKQLSAGKPLKPEEEAMLHTMLTGSDFVCAESLRHVLDWHYSQNTK